ncbi:neutral zinc metallopeptidase [Chitinophaga sp. GCM10012297]|uniref:Neutral zinc metallopeptidase n=1 Tax=Chitinophaga chungangae TaxID=2821488 RepID=A0ABS3YDT5_9BACT|nr:neutral zinc metallopeptidase [Chitinophaga chungangae]MBO9152847.1 neutral zinc metallopeptidase [Chitinophaga chungangae]
MRWQGRRQSGNVEDRRGSSRGGLVAGGGIGAIVIAVIIYFLGGDPSQVLDMQQQQAGPQQQLSPEQQAAEAEADSLVRVVLKETEDVWNKEFAQMNQQYVEPKLILFSGMVQSACGGASAASGPFYCPADQQVYIDLSFYNELENQLNAPGDFAMAYVVAHEVGHHVQNLLGISEKVQAQRGRLSEAEYNKLSVKLELQADFLAGLWAHHTAKLQNVIEPGDIEEALNAANAIGDDRLQKQSRGYVVPDAFTHGTSAQRMYWFKKGFETGDIRQGDTFNNER